MSIKLIAKIITNPKYLTTYNTGLLQAKAYRILKDRTSLFLKEYGLTTLDWATLGILMNNKESCQPKVIADILGVEKPYVTVLINKLMKLDLIAEQDNEKDRRSKLVVLTAKAKIMIPKVEEELKKEMKLILKGVSNKDILGYIKTLEAIIDNEKIDY